MRRDLLQRSLQHGELPAQAGDLPRDGGHPPEVAGAGVAHPGAELQAEHRGDEVRLRPQGLQGLRAERPRGRRGLRGRAALLLLRAAEPWLRTNGVGTNGAAAKVMNSDRLGEKGTPWHFWEDKSRLTGAPKKSFSQKTQKCSDPISADPICPFPRASRRRRGRVRSSGRSFTSCSISQLDSCSCYICSKDKTTRKLFLKQRKINNNTMDKHKIQQRKLKLIDIFSIPFLGHGPEARRERDVPVRHLLGSDNRCMCMYVYIYIYIYIHVCIYIYI